MEAISAALNGQRERARAHRPCRRRDTPPRCGRCHFAAGTTGCCTSAKRCSAAARSLRPSAIAGSHLKRRASFRSTATDRVFGRRSTARPPAVRRRGTTERVVQHDGLGRTECRASAGRRTSRSHCATQAGHRDRVSVARREPEGPDRAFSPEAHSTADVCTQSCCVRPIRTSATTRR